MRRRGWTPRPQCVRRLLPRASRCPGAPHAAPSPLSPAKGGERVDQHIQRQLIGSAHVQPAPQAQQQAAFSRQSASQAAGGRHERTSLCPAHRLQKEGKQQQQQQQLLDQRRHALSPHSHRQPAQEPCKPCEKGCREPAPQQLPLLQQASLTNTRLADKAASATLPLTRSGSRSPAPRAGPSRGTWPPSAHSRACNPGMGSLHWSGAAPTNAKAPSRGAWPPSAHSRACIPGMGSLHWSGAAPTNAQAPSCGPWPPSACSRAFNPGMAWACNPGMPRVERPPTNTNANATIRGTWPPSACGI